MAAQAVGVRARGDDAGLWAGALDSVDPMTGCHGLPERGVAEVNLTPFSSAQQHGMGGAALEEDTACRTFCFAVAVGDARGSDGSRDSRSHHGCPACASPHASLPLEGE